MTVTDEDSKCSTPELFCLEKLLGGVTEHVGLPAVKLFNGMKIQFCDSPHANKEYMTPNYGGTRTTAKLEFEFVTQPDLSKEYPGGRMGEDILVYLLAAGAHTERDRCT